MVATSKAHLATITDILHTAVQKVDIRALLLRAPTNLAVHLKAVIANSSSIASRKDSTRTRRPNLQHSHMASNRRTELLVLSRNTELHQTRNNHLSTNMERPLIPKPAMVLQALNHHMEHPLALSLLMAHLLLLNNLHTLPVPNTALNPRRGPHRLEVSNIKTLMDVHMTSNILPRLPIMEVLPKTVGIYLLHNINTSKVCTMQSILVDYTVIVPLHLYHTAATPAKILPKEATMDNQIMVDSNDGNLIMALGLRA